MHKFIRYAFVPGSRSGRLAGQQRRSVFSHCLERTVFWLFIFAVLALVPRAEAATPAPAPLVLCTGQPIPSGYAITMVSRTPKCGAGLGKNTMTLKPYAGLKTFTACAPLNLPGYLITAVATTSACQGIDVVIKDRTVTFPTYNTVTLAAYAGLKSIRVCAPLQNIPSGYLVTARSTTTGCKATQGGLTAWNTMTLTAYTGLATLNACMPLPIIPPGYVVTAQIRTAACSGAPGVNTVTLKRL